MMGVTLATFFIRLAASAISSIIHPSRNEPPRSKCGVPYPLSFCVSPSPLGEKVGMRGFCRKTAPPLLWGGGVEGGVKYFPPTVTERNKERLQWNLVAYLEPLRCLKASNNATAPACAAFNELTWPAIGIDTQKSHLSRTSRLMPMPSPPV